jgi:hypothetical protein
MLACNRQATRRAAGWGAASGKAGQGQVRASKALILCRRSFPQHSRPARRSGRCRGQHLLQAGGTSGQRAPVSQTGLHWQRLRPTALQCWRRSRRSCTCPSCKQPAAPLRSCCRESPVHGSLAVRCSTSSCCLGCSSCDRCFHTLPHAAWPCPLVPGWSVLR